MAQRRTTNHKKVIKGLAELKLDTRLNKLIVLFALVMLVGGPWLFQYLRPVPPPKVDVSPPLTVDIGAYPNLLAEQRASLQRLSRELSQHPEASGVRILAGPSTWRHGVMGYMRAARLPQYKQAFWFDDRFSSPDFGIVKGKFQGISVLILSTEEEIHAVARKNGVAEDVQDYNYQLGVKNGVYPPPGPHERKRGRQWVFVLPPTV